MPKASRVFINCPFDVEYKPLFDAMVFTVFDCRFEPHCVLEIDNAATHRLERTVTLMKKCMYGIHDISCTELDHRTGLPRFNMPFELGLFLGAKQFGGRKQSEKITLILDRGRFRFRKFFSDIAGSDITSHKGKPKVLVRVIRDWLQTASRKSGNAPLASGELMWERYKAFRAELPVLCKNAKLNVNALNYADYTWLIESWLRVNT